jgi:hypothetical protein
VQYKIHYPDSDPWEVPFRTLPSQWTANPEAMKGYALRRLSHTVEGDKEIRFWFTRTPLYGWDAWIRMYPRGSLSAITSNYIKIIIPNYRYLRNIKFHSLVSLVILSEEMWGGVCSDCNTWTDCYEKLDRVVGLYVLAEEEANPCLERFLDACERRKLRVKMYRKKSPMLKFRRRKPICVKVGGEKMWGRTLEEAASKHLAWL